MKSEDTGKPARGLIAELAEAARGDRLDRREFLALASTLGASTATTYGLLGLAAPAPARAATPKKGGILRIAMNVLDIADPRLYDWSEKSNVARQFLEPLVRWKPDYTFAGMLCERWEVSDDARTYTLHLRRTATWNNGDRFDADDVVFNLERWCDTSAEGNSMATRLGALIDAEAGKARAGSIEKLDDFTVRLNLETPDITLIAGMSDYTALLVHRDFDQVGDLKDAPVGTGPFELVSIALGDRAEVKRRESGWWGGEVYLDGVEFIDYGEDTTTIVSAFESEEIDVNERTPPDFIPILDDLGLARKDKATATTIVARMRADSPPFDSKAVRNAMQLAVNNEEVLQIGYGGAGLVAENHHVGPMHPEYAELPPVPQDQDAARRLLEEAGQAEMEVELTSVSGDWRSTTSDAIAAQLRKIGVKVNRTVIPGATFWNNWTGCTFSTTDWGSRPLGVQALALAYKSDSPWNESGHVNPEFDAKLEQALGVFDVEKRRVLMADLQAMLQDSGAIIQPYWISLSLHHVEALKGYERHQSREMHLEEVWLDR